MPRLPRGNKNQASDGQGQYARSRHANRNSKRDKPNRNPPPGVSQPGMCYCLVQGKRQKHRHDDPEFYGIHCSARRAIKTAAVQKRVVSAVVGQARYVNIASQIPSCIVLENADRGHNAPENYRPAQQRIKSFVASYRLRHDYEQAHAVRVMRPRAALSISTWEMARVIPATKLNSTARAKMSIAIRTGLPPPEGVILPAIQNAVNSNNNSSEYTTAGVPLPPRGANMSEAGMNMSRKRYAVR